MKLSDIKLTGLSITSNQDGSENLYISAASGDADDEVFYTKTITTKGTLTLEHLQKMIETTKEAMSG